MRVLSESIPVNSWGWDPNAPKITQLFFNMPKAADAVSPNRDPSDPNYGVVVPRGQFAFSIPIKLPGMRDLAGITLGGTTSSSGGDSSAGNTATSTTSETTLPPLPPVSSLTAANITMREFDEVTGEYINFFKIKFCNDFPFCIDKKAEFLAPGFQFNEVTRDDFIVLPDGFGSEKYTRITDRSEPGEATVGQIESASATRRKQGGWGRSVPAGGGAGGLLEFYLGATVLVAMTWCW
eukprot:g13601.t1